MINDNSPKNSIDKMSEKSEAMCGRELDALVALLEYIGPETREYSDRAAQLVALAREILIAVGRVH